MFTCVTRREKSSDMWPWGLSEKSAMEGIPCVTGRLTLKKETKQEHTINVSRSDADQV